MCEEPRAGLNYAPVVRDDQIRYLTHDDVNRTAINRRFVINPILFNNRFDGVSIIIIIIITTINIINIIYSV